MCVFREVELNWVSTYLQGAVGGCLHAVTEMAKWLLAGHEAAQVGWKGRDQWVQGCCRDDIAAAGAARGLEVAGDGQGAEGVCMRRSSCAAAAGAA